MAVDKIATGSTLRLQLQTGVDGNGDPIIRSKSLTNVKPEAQDQDIFDVAQALVGLQESVLENVLRIDTARLEEVL
ncbi:MAG: DUF1659 domain-containing protein [Desulfotomaculaceae bacterium]